MSTWKGVRIVALGVLCAAAIIWGVWSASQPSDFECGTQRLKVMQGDMEDWEMHDACR